MAASEETETADGQNPVFGFLLLGGVFAGATVRDVRLANELVRRRYEVHVWWAFDCPDPSALDVRIPQRLLFHPLRYRCGGRPSGLLDMTGRLFNRLTSYRWRAKLVQTSPRMPRRLLNGLLQRIADGVDADRHLLRRFAQEIKSANVTHMLPGLEVLSPFVEAARRVGGLKFRYLVTFQSYEVCLNGIDAPELKQRLMAVIRESVNLSDLPAIAVGKHYRERILREIGLRSDQIFVLHPCVEEPVLLPPERALELVATSFPGFQAAVPLIAFVGRLDVEKGLDLLLYAAALCRRDGMEFQLLICGPSALGSSYGQICRQIASHLQLPVLWGGMVSDELRSAIFQLSRVVVYPSIHGEPYGMAPMEAMLHGSQAIVAENSGVVDDNPDVLTFPAGDSRSLADCMAMALRNDRQLKPIYTTPGQLAGQLLTLIRGSRQ